MYSLQQAMHAIRSNWVASIATITTMTLSLAILAAFSLTSLNLNLVLSDLQDELQVSAFLGEGANHSALVEAIRQWPEVDSRRVYFVSKDEALFELVNDLPSLREGASLVANPLPNTIELRLLDPAQTPVVSQRLQRLPGVDGVIDGSEAVDIFLAINDSLRIGGSILIVILLSSALFAIVNSIRAAISARRNEIEVMRLVGATRGFIRMPFLIEGFLLGLFSAVVTLALVVPGYQLIVNRLSQELEFIPLVRDPALLAQVAILLTTLALLVGLVGSAISISQHLREGS
ncbi:MAG: permease-like cell division protein FtsX [Trueperaceae bacterium]